MKPIIFNTEMVKAILDGRKTQTRRVIKIKNKLTRDWAENTGVEWIRVDLTDEKYPYSIREQNGAWNDYSLKDFIKKYSQYKVDDVLYVRETTWEVDCDCQSPNYCSKTFGYGADNFDFSGVKCYTKTIPSIHMRKYNARIFLKVTNVRVERLQDISFDDIFAEGFKPYSKNILLESLKNKTLSKLNDDVKDWWINLWNSTAKDGYKWEDNPFVFVYEFEGTVKEDS